MKWMPLARRKLTSQAGAPTHNDAARGAALLVVFLVLALNGCRQPPAAAIAETESAQAIFTNAMAGFHAPSAEAHGAERDRLLSEAARRYEKLLASFPAETNLCAQALRALGGIHATQGRTNQAVKLYAAVGDKYPGQDWEVLMAWKGAADLLWESNQRDDAKKFYLRIVERFGIEGTPPIVQQVVRGSRARAGNGPPQG